MSTHSKVYDSYAQAERAVNDLEAAGIPASEISVVANNHVNDREADNETTATGAGAGIGAAVGGGAGLLAGLGMLAIPGLGPVVAVGWLAATAVGVVAGTASGGLLGALIGVGIPETHAHVYTEAVRRGGTLVTVRSNRDDGTIDEIMGRHGPINPDTRAREYRDAGWAEFDPNAPTYRPTRSAR